jgi:uncharacterized protein
MEEIANEVHTKTRAQVFLVTINTLEGEPVETFANELFAKWKIGEKKTDRGVLMLFAINDHKRWIEIGYGLEPILNDAKVGDIGRDMLPSLKTAQYDDATRLGLIEISRVIAADSNVSLDSASETGQPEQVATPAPVPEEATGTSSADWWSIGFYALWFVFILTIVIRAIVRQSRAGGSINPGNSGWSTSDGSSYSSSPGNSGWSTSDSSSYSSSSSDSGSFDSGGFSGGDGGSSGGGGAGGDW